jgi:hypothetical protein
LKIVFEEEIIIIVSNISPRCFSLEIANPKVSRLQYSLPYKKSISLPIVAMATLSIVTRQNIFSKDNKR